MSTSLRTLFTFLYKAALSGINFIVSVIVARYLNLTDRALFQLAGTYAQMGMMFVGGFTNYYAFAVPKRPADRVRIVQMGNLLVFGASLVVWIVVAAAWLFAPDALRRHPEWTWAVACTPWMFIFGYGTRLLNAMDEISWLNRMNIMQPVLFLVVYVVLWTQREMAEPARLDWTYVLWFASYGLTALWTMTLVYRRLGLPGVTLWRWSTPDWHGTLHYGGWSSVAQAVNYANYRMDFWLVAAYLGSAAASVYGVAVVASEVLLNLSGSLASVVFARMTGGSREDAIALTEVSSRQTLISSAIVAAGMYVAFPWLIRLAYGHRYEGAVWPFFVLLPGLVYKAASNIVIQYATNSLGQPITSIWMNGVSALVNAALCVVLLPIWGVMGGAVASTASYVISFYLYGLWFAHVTGHPASALWRVTRDDIAAYRRLLAALWRPIRSRLSKQG